MLKLLADVLQNSLSKPYPKPYTLNPELNYRLKLLADALQNSLTGVTDLDISCNAVNCFKTLHPELNPKPYTLN